MIVAYVTSLHQAQHRLCVFCLFVSIHEQSQSSGMQSAGHTISNNVETAMRIAATEKGCSHTEIKMTGPSMIQNFSPRKKHAVLQ